MTYLSYRSPAIFPGSRGHWGVTQELLMVFSWLQPCCLAILVSLQSQLRESPVPSQVRDYCNSPKPIPSFPSMYSGTTFPSLFYSCIAWGEFQPKTVGRSDVPHFLTWPRKPPVCSLALSVSISFLIWQLAVSAQGNAGRHMLKTPEPLSSWVPE